ncbi:PAS domain-containing protein [Priestia megaterium]
MDGLVLWDGKRNIIDVNSSLCDILELSKEEICAHSMEDFISSANLDAVIEHKETIEQKGKLKERLRTLRGTKKLKISNFPRKRYLARSIYDAFKRRNGTKSNARADSKIGYASSSRTVSSWDCA